MYVRRITPLYVSQTFYLFARAKVWLFLRVVILYFTTCYSFALPTSLGWFIVLGLPPLFFSAKLRKQEMSLSAFGPSRPYFSDYFRFAKVRQWERAFSAIWPFLPILVDSCRLFLTYIKHIEKSRAYIVRTLDNALTRHNGFIRLRCKGRVKGKNKPPTQGVRVGGACLSTFYKSA